MKNLLVSIVALTVIGTCGASFSFASEQEEGTPLEACETLAVEQNIPSEDIEQFVIDCIDDIERSDEEFSLENDVIEPDKE